jgi:hypothetical protein
MFCEENYSCNSQPPQYKKKFDKDNFGENHKKKHKNHVGKHCSNPKCLKKKNTKLNS